MIRHKKVFRTKVKYSINIGCLFDIPTGTQVTGARGETILNGGLSKISANIGTGNQFKSMLMHYSMLSAFNVVSATHETVMETYDTEINIQMSRLEHFSKPFPYIKSDGLVLSEEAPWTVSDKGTKPGEIWFKDFSDFCSAKIKDKGSYATYTAFLDPYTKKPIVDLIPSFSELDSLSDLESSTTVENIIDDVNSKQNNTVFMKQGAFKTKILSLLPGLCNQANVHMMMVGQLGKKIEIPTPATMFSPPRKALQFLKADDSIKNVSGKFFFLLNDGWYINGARLLNNPSTKMAEYPKGDESLGTDLNIVRITQLRGKNGPSGFTIGVIVSQIDGVQPTLTEFHHVKSIGRFGISGSNVSYNMDLKPDVKLSRTTVRTKIDEDPLLRRAINITSEVLQYNTFSNIEGMGLMCTMTELYDDLIKLGYDWDILLKTRGFWAIDQYTSKLPPFLSTMDLLRMRKGQYVPYWMDSKTKEVNKTWKHHFETKN